jgi:hypothetical protein
MTRNKEVATRQEQRGRFSERRALSELRFFQETAAENAKSMPSVVTSKVGEKWLKFKKK